MLSWTPAFSPHYQWAHVTDSAVRQRLRQAFARGGLPRCLRVDNGKPWGSWSDLPTVLALWLIGLGVEVIWNPPRQPQKNGVVERSQGTAKRWAEPQCCASVAELQRRLHDDDRLQRERYPFLGRCSRWEVFPGLRHSGRAYGVADEGRRWELERVLRHLTEYAVTRRVDRTGQVSLYNRNYYVGVVHGGQTVYVMFDPQAREWLFSDREGKQLRSQAAVEIDQERICALDLAGPK